jgi:nucleoside-diphosphate-sugar epimerase
MQILVTGGAGYLGSILLPRLVARGHKVRVLDLGYFGFDHLLKIRSDVEIIRDDIKRIFEDTKFAEDLLNGCDCVIHLAAISNDPSADLDPSLTTQVNLDASLVLAEMCRAKGIRFIFSSSCSVYGEAEGEADELHPVNPLTVYAESKAEAERALEELSDGNWKAVVLRNGTLFGYSPRMRFDLVANIFALHSTLRGEITIFGDGLQWRPFLHVRDCARAFVFAAENCDLQHVCYNVANENLRVVDLISTFQSINPQLRVNYTKVENQDHRDYQVTTQRFRNEGFQPMIPLEVGAEELVEALVTGRIPEPDSILYRNVNLIKELSGFSSQEHRGILDLIDKLSKVRTPS